MQPLGPREDEGNKESSGERRMTQVQATGAQGSALDHLHWGLSVETLKPDWLLSNKQPLWSPHGPHQEVCPGQEAPSGHKPQPTGRQWEVKELNKKV